MFIQYFFHPTQVGYSDGFVFTQLERLKLCVCTDNDNPSSLLVRFLEDSPNLRVLDIIVMVKCFFHKQFVFGLMHNMILTWFSAWSQDHYDMFWNDDHSPIAVPDCILTSLQTFNWSGYLERRPQERDLEVYILGKRWSPKDCNNLAWCNV